MSMKDFSSRVKGDPDVVARAQDAATERARRVWNDLWREEIYPMWQPTLKLLSKMEGVEFAGHQPVHGFPAGAPSEVLNLITKKPSDFLVSQDVIVRAKVPGVGVTVSYVFSGDANDGAMVRLVSFEAPGVEGRRFKKETVKQWFGNIDRLEAAAIEDIDESDDLFGTVLIEALDAKVAAEQKAREDEEKKVQEENRRRVAVAHEPAEDPDPTAAPATKVKSTKKK